jgi:uncharacterized protein
MAVTQWGVHSGELARGIALFNRALFFEAHEVLEDVWRAAPAEQKKFMQGLVQLAVAFHHHSTGNHVGMRSVMERGLRNLDGYPNDFCGVKLLPLKHSLNEWREALDNRQPPPSLPRIESSGPGLGG